MLLEPSAYTDVAGEGQVERWGGRIGETAPEGFRVAISSANFRAAFVAGALGLCLIGLLGAPSGLLWVVLGVWATRAACGRPPGLVWGIVCVGAGSRWGSLSLADVEAATRMLGPTLTAGPVAVRMGMGLAFVSAIVSEAGAGDLRSGAWPVRSAGVVATVALAALFVVPGPAGPSLFVPIALWTGCAAAVAAIVLVLGRVPTLPTWIPIVVSVAALIGSGLTR